MKGSRVADEAIYLGSQYSKPKHHFIETCSLWKSVSKLEAPRSILDVGCANGAFLHYCSSTFPSARLVGIDSVESLILEAATNVPSARAFVADINSNQCDLGRDRFDLIHMAGVLCIFDDPEQAIVNCLAALSGGGVLVLFGSFNRYPIDMLMRYRTSKSEKSEEWQTGSNVFSRNTIENIVEKSGFRATVEWHDFVLPQRLERGGDVMRAWTDRLESGRQIHVNGAMQLLDMQFAIIQLADG
jgi:trans-aconitate methyltransferase